MERTVLHVTGMDCRRCAERLERTLSRLEGVAHVVARADSGTVEVLFDPGRASVETAQSCIEQAGFGVA